MRSVWFWVGVLIVTGVLSLQDIAKFFGMEEQAKPMIAFIDEYINIGDWIKKIRQTIDNLSLPDFTDGAADPAEKK